MGYRFTVTDAYAPKRKMVGVWPNDPGYWIDPYDVLTKNVDGTWTKHTGLCITNLVIPDEDMEFIGTRHLELV